MNRDIFLGRTDDGERVYVQIRVEPLERPTTDINHQPVTEGVLRLAITGEVIEKHKQEAYTAGQCREYVGRVTKPEAPWTIAELLDLDEVWARWHLNDMRAYCAHQEKRWEQGRYGRQLDLNQVCPETGYKAGSAWLYEPMPPAVLDQVRVWQRRLRP